MIENDEDAFEVAKDIGAYIRINYSRRVAVAHIVGRPETASASWSEGDARCIQAVMGKAAMAIRELERKINGLN